MADQENFDIIIDPNRPQRGYWRDLWKHRELLLFFAWRDILVRYRQAIFGIGWAVMRPLSFMLIFVFVFSYIAALPSQGIPYYQFVLVGMIVWQLFSTSVQDSSQSLINNTNLISKVYFPRVLLPVSNLIVNFLDFLICLALTLLYLFAVGWSPRIEILALPVSILLTLSLSLGFALWLGALNVQFRDFRFLIPFGLQLGLYASPVGYSGDIVPDDLHAIYNLNPLVGILGLTRYAIFGIWYPELNHALTISFAWAVFLLVTGFIYFRQTERKFADVI